MQLTPTQDLLMEVLAARYRLGESIWTFANSAAARHAAKKLADQGLIFVMNGQVEHTFRAGLTEAGKAERHFNRDYNPPIFRDITSRLSKVLHGLMHGSPGGLYDRAAAEIVKEIMS